MNPPYLAKDYVAELSGTPLRELDRVVLTVDLESEGGRLPSGADGTVVAVWGSGEAYEVEFSSPLHALVTVERDRLRKLPA